MKIPKRNQRKCSRRRYMREAWHRRRLRDNRVAVILQSTYKKTTAQIAKLSSVFGWLGITTMRATAQFAAAAKLIKAASIRETLQPEMIATIDEMARTTMYSWMECYQMVKEGRGRWTSR